MNQSVQAAPGVDFHGRISGGRGSTAAQRTNRERAPQHAAGKVQVELHSIETGHLQEHSHAVSTLLECQLNGAHSPHASYVANLRNVLDFTGQLCNHGYSAGCWLEFHGFRRPAR